MGVSMAKSVFIPLFWYFVRDSDLIRSTVSGLLLPLHLRLLNSPLVVNPISIIYMYISDNSAH